MLIFWLINIILWVAFAAYNFYFLSKRVDKIYNIKIDFHFFGAVVACIIATAFPVIDLLNITNTFWDICKLFLITLVLRWNVFDPALNIMSNQKWWYYGNITKNFKKASVPYLKNGKLDIWFGWKQIPIKFVLLIVVTILSFVL